MKKVVFVILAVTVFSCNKEQKTMSGLIPEDTLARVLIEIHIAEAKVSQAKLTKDSSLNYYSFLEQGIFNKYNIDSLRYRETMVNYSEDIKILDRVYEVVLDSLNLRTAVKPKIKKD